MVSIGQISMLNIQKVWIAHFITNENMILMTSADMKEVPFFQGSPQFITHKRMEDDLELTEHFWSQQGKGKTFSFTSLLMFTR